ncbi:hypothetical protein OGAPHI_003609 [Ogataea philodendri]|uniref:mRNA stability protein n=1 Tax=Ogataea philodendri TaxID=1378263 RepID=A0A9P8P5I2_9ASCO|nr:uncharacterized protein OGAPHI_003609 [Ogataea philodendri]KAH3665425.1 hypothetical protein OGAPHI_003609 [Ogataea philodendri]
MDLQYASDSEDESVSPLKPPPPNLYLKYSKQWTFQRKSGICRKTAFIYLNIQPHPQEYHLLQNLANKTWQQVQKLYVVDNASFNDHFLYDNLTQTYNNLHISLSYNLSFEDEDQFNQFVNTFQSNSTKPVPAEITFSGIVKLLPNLDGSKCFISLMLSEDSQKQLKKTVELINANIPPFKDGFHNQLYSPEYLHCTIGEIRHKDLDLQWQSEPISLRATSCLISNGIKETPLASGKLERVSSSKITTMSGLSPNDPLYEPPQTDEVSKLTPQEQKLYKMYGRLPKKSELLQSKLKDRKFFDSGDYAMSKATGHKEQVGSINPLRLPNIEDVARINRNSISGVSATGLLSAHQQKSNLDNEARDANEEAIEDD